MKASDFNTIWKGIKNQSLDLGKTLFKKWATQAQADAEDFLENSKAGVKRAIELCIEGTIDKDEMEDLILGKKDLADMHALKQAGLASAAVDTFVNGVLNIIVDAAFAAIP